MLAADRGLAASSSGRSWPEGVVTVLRGNFHRAPCLPTRALCRHASTRATTGSLSAATAVPDCPLPPAQRPASSAADAFPSSCAVTSGALLAASGGGPQPSAGGGAGSGGRPGTAQAERRPAAAPQRPGGATGSGGGGGGGPSGEDDSASDSFQIGLDPFSQQLGLSALTGGAAAAIAAAIHLDLLACLRPDPGALALAAQLAAPVLALLGGVLAPTWAPPFKGTELQRLQHNYYMTAQVLQLYLEEDEEEEEGEGAEAEGGGSLASGERARVRRRLRLDQAVGWGTISSGLALMQAYTLQPWNQPTGNSVFALALLGRSAQQLANEFLVRGAGWGLLSGWLFAELSSADASDGILFFGKVFGGPDAIKYAAGLGLVALSVPGALWEARSARNFVRASVVGPVRDAAIFCTGNGVDEPAYCDPKGFAMMAARRPQNAAPVADVVTKTRAWRSGPQSSFSSVSSVGSMDAVDAADLNPDARAATPSPTAAAAATAATPASDANSAAAGDAAGSTGAAAAASSNGAAKAAASSNGSSGSSNGSGSGAGSGSGGGGGGGPMPAVGPTVAASSMAFEWDSEDMGVLLRVETFQDTIAFWSALYYQLLAAFAINGAFLASDCNLLASFGAAWLLRTGPLLLAEARARLTAARAAA